MLLHKNITTAEDIFKYLADSDKATWICCKLV